MTPSGGLVVCEDLSALLVATSKPRRIRERAARRVQRRERVCLNVTAKFAASTRASEVRMPGFEPHFSCPPERGLGM